MPEKDPLSVKYLRTGETVGSPIIRKFTIPQNYSSASIKEILTRIVWGNGKRIIVYEPQESEACEPKVISDSELKELRSLSKEDRLAQLDMLAMTLKASPNKMIVQFTKLGGKK